MSFWKDINKLKNVGSNVLASTVDAATGEHNICNMWKKHYGDLLNSNVDDTHKEHVQQVVKELNNVHDFEKVSFAEVSDAIKDLKSGKCAGIDNLQSEHFKYAHDSLSCLLSMILNAMLSHGYVPPKIMYTIIVPIIKDKKGLVTDKDNYRPIAITTVMSKLMELILLERMSDELQTVCNQFGFKRKSGTDFCIFTLKQIIEFYKYKNSPVYICFLDASKAFDRVNHWSLFKKLIDRNVNVILIRLLLYWYRCQEFCVRWGNTISDFFHVSNGVRQGGIMSPTLFNVYMDDLSKRLNKSGIGCSFNGVLYNHLMYADDTCIIAPSPCSLYKLLGECSDFAIENTILFNSSKSKYMCLKPKSLSKLHVPNMYLNGELLKCVSKTKYLGVFIDNPVTDDEDIMRHVKAIYARGNIMVNRFKKCSEDVKIHLFQSYLSSVYGSQLWTTFKPSVFKKAVVAYNNVCRKLFSIGRRDSMSTFYVANNLDSFNVLYRKSIGNFRDRLMICDNSLVRNIVSSVYFTFNSSHAHVWQSVLFT